MLGSLKLSAISKEIEDLSLKKNFEAIQSKWSDYMRDFNIFCEILLEKYHKVFISPEKLLEIAG